MFSQSLAAHAAKTERAAVNVDREAKAAAAAARASAQAAVQAVDAAPGAAFGAETAIGLELRGLKAAADRAAARAGAWAPALDAADAALRGWGDSATFLEATVAELARVEAVLVRAAGQVREERQQSAPGAPGGSGGAWGSEGRAQPLLLPRE